MSLQYSSAVYNVHGRALPRCARTHTQTQTRAFTHRWAHFDHHQPPEKHTKISDGKTDSNTHSQRSCENALSEAQTDTLQRQKLHTLWKNVIKINVPILTSMHSSNNCSVVASSVFWDRWHRQSCRAATKKGIKPKCCRHIILSLHFISLQLYSCIALTLRLDPKREAGPLIAH